MNTLTISEIFSNFSFYQENYLSIVQDSQQYFIPVPEAYIQIWSNTQEPLYLGDLLQLWFSEKWCVQSSHHLSCEKSGQKEILKSFQNPQNLYVYQIKGNIFTGKNHSIAWSRTEEKIYPIKLDSVFKHYCYSKSLAHPKRYLNQPLNLIV